VSAMLAEIGLLELIEQVGGGGGGH